MIKQLILTTMLTTGVATTTPVYNAPNMNEQAVITQNYDQEIQINDVATTQITDEDTNHFTIGGPYEWFNTGINTDLKQNLSKNLNYLNVQGNIYSNKIGRNITINHSNELSRYILDYSRVYEWDSINQTYVLDPTKVNQYPHCERSMVCLQITPYNFNVNTEAKIILDMEVYGWTDTHYNTDVTRTVFTPYELYYIKKVYTSTDSMMSTFINRQVTNYQAYNIEQEIENPNSNFYYENTTEVVNTNWPEPDSTTHIGRQTLNETDIIISPNTINYVFIEYIPVIREKLVITYDNETYEVEDVALAQQMQNAIVVEPPNDKNLIHTVRISGTNIIPQGDYEVVDIPGLMFDILSMPFAFVSQAFNLTLFPGTQYQVNIANLFLSVIAIAVFIWLIGLFMNKKG